MLNRTFFAILFVLASGITFGQSAFTVDRGDAAKTKQETRSSSALGEVSPSTTMSPEGVSGKSGGGGGVPKIQIAILLDTSGSMSGLINQARSQLWNVVNSFASAKRDGKQARLEVGLFEYGAGGLSHEVGFTRRLSPLTTDIDFVSSKLFSSPVFPTRSLTLYAVVYKKFNLSFISSIFLKL